MTTFKPVTQDFGLYEQLPKILEASCWPDAPYCPIDEAAADDMRDAFTPSQWRVLQDSGNLWPRSIVAWTPLQRIEFLNIPQDRKDAIVRYNHTVGMTERDAEDILDRYFPVPSPA